MTICEASWHQGNWTDLLAITKETQDIWSGGMGLADRITFLSKQSSLPWARKHIKRYVLLKNGKPASSCKLFKLNFAFRNRSIDLYGLGGIFTASQFRQQGLAAQLVKEMIDIAKRNEQAGVLLFSDIGTDYYERLGFEAFAGNNFAIDLSDVSKMQSSEGISYQIKPLEESDIADITCHYQKWLSQKAYGRRRDSNYWSFRIWSERQFQIFSGWQWPVQELVRFKFRDKAVPGYAIIECSQTRMRILEVIANSDFTNLIWQSLIEIAQARNFKQIRGWEATSPANTFAQTKNSGAKSKLVEREWAQPMILPLSKPPESWLAEGNCQLLELDSF